MTIHNNILVERETFEKNGKTYFSYFIKGNTPSSAAIELPKTISRTVYPPLSGGTIATLTSLPRMLPFEIKDDATGKVISGNTFSVISYDENGEVYECGIKPFRASDKALLNMMLR